MLKRLMAIRISRESLAAILLIAVFSAFILVNFNFGFNLFFYAIIAIIGLIIPLIYPRAGIYAIVVLMLIFAKFFSLQSIIIDDAEYKFYLVDIIFSASLFSIFLRLLAGKIKVKLQRVDFILIAFLILTIAYFIISISYLDSFFNPAFSSLKNYVFYPLLYFAVYFLFTAREHWTRFFKFLIVGATTVVGFIAYGLITGQGLWTEITPLTTSGSRILDFDHAFYISAIFLIGLAYILFKKDELAKYFYILLPIFAIGIVGSLMRHLWIAIFIAIVFLYIIIYQQRKKIFRKVFAKYVALGLMIFSVIFLLVNLLPFSKLSADYFSVQENVIERAVSISNSQDTSIAWRNTVWQGVWKEYKQNLVFGMGFGRRIFIDMGGYSDYVEVRNIHNSWLAIFVQMGLLGIGFLIWFIINIAKHVLSKKQAVLTKNLNIIRIATMSILMLCVVAFLFQPYLEANFFSWLFWINLGLARRYYEGITS
ncbi:MAG: O-antigen ligase family protein [bacterium]